jgi:hypothetical protein
MLEAGFGRDMGTATGAVRSVGAGAAGGAGAAEGSGAKGFLCMKRWLLDVVQL